MILSGNEIRRRLGKELFIEPFNQSQLGPNSYNLRLHNELMIYDEPHLDMKKEHQVSNELNCCLCMNGFTKMCTGTRATCEVGLLISTVVND